MLKTIKHCLKKTKEDLKKNKKHPGLEDLLLVKWQYSPN